MSLETLAGMAAAQARIRKTMMGSNAIANMLKTQKHIEKATTHYKLLHLASISKAIAGNHRKLKSLGLPDLFFTMGEYKLNNNWISNIHSIAANAARIEANWKKIISTSPLVEVAKQYKPAIDILIAQQAAIANNDFISSMQAIAANAERIRQYWQKAVGESPLVRMAREFRQPDHLKGILNPDILRLLEPAIVTELNTQTEQAAVLAENYGARDHVSQKDLEQFKEFVATSFSALATAFKKSQRSPMALIAFWSGIIGLLWGIVYPLTQSDAATQSRWTFCSRRIVR